MKHFLPYRKKPRDWPKSILSGAALIAFCLTGNYAKSQSTFAGSDMYDMRRGAFPKEKDGELYQIKADGFYRFFGTQQYMPDPYLLFPEGGETTNKRTLFIGDDTQLPNLWVNINGRPNKKTSWGFDIFAFQFLNGNIGPTYGRQIPTNQLPNVWNPLAGGRLGQSMGLNLGVNIYGTQITNFGTFNIRMGGIHWVSISDLTLANFQGYNRFMMFERNPWDPIGRSLGSRYEQMYKTGGVSQDFRWGERAFQGTIIEGINLPGNWTFMGLYGKTELAGGFLTIPNINYGGKVRKIFENDQFISFNTLNNTTWLDSLNQNPLGFNIVTFETKVNVPGFVLHAEVGTGRYVSPLNDYPWGEAINIKATTTKKITKFPIELNYYRINPNVVNNNGIFFNTSVLEAREVDQPRGGVQSANVLIPFASSMVALGQMTNNRTGLNLNTMFSVGKWNWNIGYGVSSEIIATQNTITYTHFVNQLIRARFWRWDFPPSVGPYGNYTKVYRDAFQRVTVTDDSMGIAVNPKKFTQFEAHGRYSTKIGYKNFYAFFLGRYNTAQPDFTLIPQFNEQAYIRQYNSELEMYLEITPKFIINSYLGYERVLGNYQTELNLETQRPLNQTGWGTGLGIDISLGRNAAFYIRHRWFFFEDTSFRLDKFRGQETLVELKIFF
jgi:hypothetical protein